MNRRQVLKMMAAAAGVGTLAGGLPWWREASGASSFFVVTATPGDDLRRLRHAAGLRTLEDRAISVVPVAPAGQDLSMLRDGRLVDPLQHLLPGTGLWAFARELRARRAPATAMLSVELPRPARPDEVRFEVDGRLVEAVDRKRDYRRIEIHGAHGPTVFRLEGGALTAVASSCRHKLCMKMHEQRHGRIICAPNRLVAVLPQANDGIDAITG